MILAIDPGNVESAYVVVDENLKPVKFGKVKNADLLDDLFMDRFHQPNAIDHCAIEMIASYGMSVGREVFDTCVWIGRFIERANVEHLKLIYRKDVKTNLCGSMKAKDGNIRQALIDRFGEVGVKKNPGWFYGFSGDVWQAYAVAVTYHDMQRGVKTA
jgi:hypothetical protein